MSTAFAYREPSVRGDAPHVEAEVNAAADVGIVGIGYVGLPLALALADAGHRVRGFDTDRSQRARATECAAALGLAAPAFAPVARAAELAGCEIFVITVPTPTRDGSPDLHHVEAACAGVGAVLKPGALVILESTVAPGTTRQRCLPILEEASGLRAGADFQLAYSPERINPGDPQHLVTSVVKVVAGLDAASAAAASALYSAVTEVCAAPSLEVAELAKLVENAQRDVNIAFMNEVSNLTRALGVSMDDVLAVASSKWNFLNFRPGVVGGHCIAEDPYYLLSAAALRGVELPTVSAARATNEDRAERIVSVAVAEHTDPDDGVIVIYGASYKADVTDQRKSVASQLTEALGRRGYRTAVVDPLVDGEAAFARHLRLREDDPAALVIVAVVHERFSDRAEHDVRSVLRPGGTVIDLTGSIDESAFARVTRFE